MNRPFDLMARCLYRGSAVTLNSLFVGIDLMIPLVLSDGKISFLGIQVKFVQKKGVTKAVREAANQMKFHKMFFNAKESDRPFGLIILALGDYNYLKSRVIMRKEKISQFEDPPILVFEGNPESFKLQTHFFKMAPESFTCAYRGINPTYLEVCDRMNDLTTDEPL